jgi:probable phosphoglycerate mutase
MTALPGTHGRHRIYLLRHGDVNYFTEEGERVADPTLVTLTEWGREQAALMAETLAEIKFDKAFHSGMLRTQESAEIVMKGRDDIPMESLPGFREIKSGDINAMSFKRIEAEYVYGFEKAPIPGARFGGGEVLSEFRERIVVALLELLKAPDWSQILLVGHGGVNRAILSWMTNSGLEGMSTFDQDTLCLNVLDIDIIERKIVRKYIRQMNYTPYNMTKDGQFLTTVEKMFARRIKMRDG